MKNDVKGKQQSLTKDKQTLILEDSQEPAKTFSALSLFSTFSGTGFQLAPGCRV